MTNTDDAPTKSKAKGKAVTASRKTAKKKATTASNKAGGVKRKTASTTPTRKSKKKTTSAAKNSATKAKAPSSRKRATPAKKATKAKRPTKKKTAAEKPATHDYAQLAEHFAAAATAGQEIFQEAFKGSTSAQEASSRQSDPLNVTQSFGEMVTALAKDPQSWSINSSSCGATIHSCSLT